MTRNNIVIVATLVFMYFSVEASEKADSIICKELVLFYPDMCETQSIKANCSSLCNGTATPQSISCGKKWKKTDHQTNTTATTKRKRKRRIVGGVTSEGGEWPWHISLQMKGTHVCGGSILSPSVIVTAAHCVANSINDIVIHYNARDFKVVAQTNYHARPGQKVGVKHIITHAGYEFSQHPWRDLFFVYVKHDIALLILESKLELDGRSGENITSVCLPNKQTPIEPNHECNIVGFGMTQFEQGGASDHLRHADIRLVPVETCNRADSFNNTVNETLTVCAGEGTADISPCNLDSGGSLVCEINGTWYANGIVSSGYKCGGKDAYSMYTRLSSHNEWIADQLFQYFNHDGAAKSSSSSKAILSFSLSSTFVLWALFITTTVVLGIAFE